MPDDQVLRWATGAVDGTCVVSTEGLSRGGHRASGTFRLRIEGPAARATDVILKVPVPGWIAAAWVITNARALQLAETHGLAAPRLIAADLDGGRAEPSPPWRPSCPAAPISRRRLRPHGSGKREPPLPGSTPSA
jgi:hypothetical protein